jgi:hypothetical protein
MIGVTFECPWGTALEAMIALPAIALVLWKGRRWR